MRVMYFKMFSCVQNRINIEDMRLLSFESHTYKIGTWLSSGSLDFHHSLIRTIYYIYSVCANNIVYGKCLLSFSESEILVLYVLSTGCLHDQSVIKSLGIQYPMSISGKHLSTLLFPTHWVGI